MLKKNIIILCVFLMAVTKVFSQELQANVTINTQQIDQTNRQVFETLQKALQEFINTTHWTDKKLGVNERIECNFIFTIDSYHSGDFSGTLQVQAFRPVYNSTYSSPLLDYKDNSIEFSYQEYQPLLYNPDRFESNLTSIIGFYVDIILGLDADSFSKNGGNSYFVKAQRIAVQAQGSGYKGWMQDGTNNRWQLAEDLLSDKYSKFHESFYAYHRLGLDTMASQPKEAKTTLSKSLIDLEKVTNSRIDSYLLQLFFDTKGDEIVSIFSQGNPINTKQIKESLLKIMPSQASKWEQIK